MTPSVGAYIIKVNKEKDEHGPALSQPNLYCRNLRRYTHQLSLRTEPMTEQELHDMWREDVLPYVVMAYELDGIADYPARRESFNNWVDSLAQDGVIPQELADDCDQPRECSR